MYQRGKESFIISALQLASTSTTEVYINPCIAQLPTLIQRFKHMPTSEVASPPTRNKVAESNLTLLSEVLNQLQQTKKVTPYTRLARIAKIEDGWYYESCIKCTHKAYQSGHKHYCPAHGFQHEHLYRYRFSATIADDSCTADAVFFDGVVRTLVGKACYDIIISQSNNDPKQLPQELEDLINKPYIFEIQAKKDSQTKAIAVNNAYEAPPSTSEPATSSSTAPATPSVKIPKRAREQDEEARQKQKTKEQ